MTNREIAKVLFNISAILQRQEGNPYRIRAYRRAARNLLRAREPVRDRLARDGSLGLPGLGKSLTAKISALATEDRLAFYSDLVAELPDDEQRLLAVPGIGPTIAARICRDIGTTDPENLRRAIANGALRRVWGVGRKRSSAIINTLCPPVAQQERLF
jgi:DNA polymerase (family 10)